MRTISVVMRTPVFSWIAHLYILCQTWKSLFLYSKMKRNEKRKEKKIKRNEKKKKRKKRGLSLSIMWELNLEVLEFGIAFMLDLTYLPITPLFPLVLLATYPYVLHLVLSPITTLKSPSDLDLHVFWFGCWF